MPSLKKKERLWSGSRPRNPKPIHKLLRDVFPCFGLASFLVGFFVAASSLEPREWKMQIQAPRSKLYRHDAPNKAPCPICGSRSTECVSNQTSGDVFCVNVTAGAAVAFGHASGWWHRSSKLKAQPITDKTPDLPPLEFRDRVYRWLLGQLSLSESHRKQLEKRGFRPEQIEAMSIKTAWRPVVSVGSNPEQMLAKWALEEFGPDVLGVPGFYVDGRSGKPRIVNLDGKMLLPVLTDNGLVQALQFRNERGANGKYRWFSSASRGGCSPSTPHHTARPVFHSRDVSTVYVTEGFFKASYSADVLALPVVGLSGVSAQAGVMETLQALGSQKVVVAFDSDKKRKPQVRKAEAQLCKALQDAGFVVQVASWSEEFKGLDDLLQANKRPSLVPYVEAPKRAKRAVKVVELEDEELFPAVNSVNVEEARANIQAFCKDVADRPAAFRGMVNVLKFSAGVGKSTALRSLMYEMEQLGIPTLRLVERTEMAKDELYRSITYVPGRLTVNEAGETFCQKSETVRALTAKRLPPSSACRACSLRSSCEYQKLRQAQPTLKQASAKHVFAPRQFWEHYRVIVWDDVDLLSLTQERVLVTEADLGAAVTEAPVEAHNLLHALIGARALAFGEYRTDPSPHHCKPLVPYLRSYCDSSGVELGDLLTEALRADLSVLVDGSLSVDELAESELRTNFLADLVAELERNLYESTFTLWITPERGFSIEMRLSKPLPLEHLRDKIHIISDSSANRGILKMLFPGMPVLVHDKPMIYPDSVRIEQHIDRRFGAVDLKSEAGRAAAKKRLRETIEASRFDESEFGVLTYKSLADELRAEGFKGQVLHFYGHRSNNTQADVKAHIVLGTPCPPPSEVIKTAHNLYRGETLDTSSSIGSAVYTSTDGYEYRSEVRKWADPRLQAIQDLAEVEELRQAVNRCRPFNVSTPRQLDLYGLDRGKRMGVDVYVFSTTPLPGLPVTVFTARRPEKPESVEPVSGAIEACKRQGLHPSEERLSEATGFSRRQVRKALAWLKAEGAKPDKVQGTKVRETYYHKQPSPRPPVGPALISEISRSNPPPEALAS